MVEDKDGSVLKFKGYSEKLSKLKLLTADEADAAKNEYENFIQYEAQLHKEEFVEFNFTNEKCRVDKFFGKFLQKNDKYQCLWKVVMITSIASSGQATIERGLVSIHK
jgi:hypothetical protein